ncbi:MAG: universal stress protein [Gemmataceae bacterium]|nr:universal stress protein [Gemmataceae bacterium]
MFTKLLLPLDLTDKHQPVLTAAVEAAQQGATVALVHVIEVIPGVSREEEQSFFDRLEQSAHAHLRKYADDLLRRGVSCQYAVLYGHRVSEVVRYAAESGADLIVLTAPRLDPDKPTAGWGSLSFRVSLLSKCSVLLVK